MAKMIQMPQSIQAPTGEQRWMYANFTDSFVFTYIMTTRMDIAKQILVRIMPELENDEIRSIRQEYRLGNAKPEKHIISNIMIRTESGRIIVIEMQNRPLPYLKKRARGYTAVIDSVLLKKGDEKYDLPDVTLIIICGFDPADRQRYVNDQVSYYRTDPDIETNDGRKVIWLNPKGRKGPVTPELKAFLDYVNGIDVDDELCDNIDRAVLEMKRSYIIRREYMFFTDYIDNERRIAKEEGINIGRNEGINENRTSLVLQHHQKGTPVETIAEILFMSEEEVRKIIRDNAVLH